MLGDQILRLLREDARNGRNPKVRHSLVRILEYEPDKSCRMCRTTRWCRAASLCIVDVSRRKAALRAMADPSRRIIYGLHALRSRLTLLRESPIFSERSGSSNNAIFSPSSSAVFPNAAALMRSSSRSGVLTPSYSNLAAHRGFCSGSGQFLPYFRNGKANFLSRSQIRSPGGYAAEARAFGNSLKSKFSSSAKTNLGKSPAKMGGSLTAKPLAALSSVASRYRAAAGLQMEAFWRRNYLVLVGVAGVFLCIFLWRLMFGVASTFIGLSEGMAKYGFLALASAIVAFSGLYVRSRFTLNPDKIYRMAMRQLNTSAGILEVMGAPLTGSDARAYIMSGGGVRLKNFRLRFGGKRCFLIFPIKGSERRGLVSIEAKKKNGQYNIKLLAVDIPTASGVDQRVFLVGDEAEYRVGGGLISELRDPIVKAMAAEKEFEDQDLKEDEEDEMREMEERQRRDAQAKAESGGS